ncbi:Serine protease, subtilisin family [Amycolatopsis tolypomycina]|uniref:Serine protease, subtilisin family n=1 Tax=Amycolatopsis tolypomycina TaxID=208445 RepID=A0A1H4XC36_9PSEU|nr:S8 family serine peptidase [Amycolatopsis tolypomycina]SED03147.1 Serine protease, subtilisin family [Amycolatopsis tolypomycina]
MNWRHPVATVLAVALATSGTVTAAAAQAAEPDPGPARTVTLVTGDRVVLAGSRGVSVLPGAGRAKTAFEQRTDVTGDVHVTPQDALAGVRSGQLDPLLFDVTKLVEFGYDDQARRDLPLIVGGGLAAARDTGLRPVRELTSLGATAVRAAKGTDLLARAARSAAPRIWLDAPVRGTLDQSVPQIGAPAAWQAGLTGSGVTVAVLDSGIDTTHPDLAGVVADARDFSGSATGTTDRWGHGTHVASIVTGRDAKYRGVAPGVRLLNGKVLGDDGSGLLSGIIAGMEWAAGGGAKVVNMSLGTRFPSDGTDVLSQAVDRLTEQTGTLFVAAAGNDADLVTSPGAATAALTVGAVDRDGKLAPFSNHGPRYGDGAIKPDVTAPGVGIAAAKARDSVLATTVPSVDEHHFRLSGTSMAAPHVAGAAAILAQQHPDWKAPELKAALMGTAEAGAAMSVFEQGAGRVDVAKAVSRPVFASPATISLGTAQWPHDDDKPLVTTVTYRNAGTTPVTLDLTTDVRGPDGAAAPDGMVTVTPGSLTIPAGGSAAATVTADTRVAGPDGGYQGVVLASGVRTPIAVTREAERYDVALTFLDEQGNPTPNFSYSFVDVENPRSFGGASPTARVPKGRFYFQATTWTDDRRYLFAVEPEFVVSGPAQLTVDTRTAVSADVRFADRPTAKIGRAAYGFERDTSWGHLSSWMHVPDFTDFRVRPSATSASSFDLAVEAQAAEPDGAGGFGTSGYLYNVRHHLRGSIPAKPGFTVRDRDMARVRTEAAVTKPGSTGTREGMITRPLPYGLDEFYTPGEPWYPLFSEDGVNLLLDAVPRSYRLGRPVLERWNAAVFGPAFPPGPRIRAFRQGDTIAVYLPMFTDQHAGRISDGGPVSAAQTTLSREGKEIGRSDVLGRGAFPVPAGPGTYVLHAEATRDNAVSSKVVVDWTFTSDTAPGTNPAALPLPAVRYAPAVDARNRVPAWLPTYVPITVETNAGGTAELKALSVSHDGGATWHAVPFTDKGALLVHPAGAKSVSLKATAADPAGNKVEQTIVDAFLLAGKA